MPSTGIFDVGDQRLITPPIRGRAEELRVIGALIAGVARGRGVLVIEGPPGIGKSRLLTELLRAHPPVWDVEALRRLGGSIDLSYGATNRDPAERLHLSLHTVKTHLHNAFAKLSIHSRARLANLVR